MPSSLAAVARGTPGWHRLARPALCGLIAGAIVATAGCSASVSDREEEELGEYQAAYIDSMVAMVDDSVVTNYIATLGRSMTSHTSRAGLNWRYKVVNVSAMNAMALPGGFVYVTRGLIEQADHMDELAGVMGHEIGHVVRRHSITQLEKAGKRDLALLMLCTLTHACDTFGGAAAVQAGANAVTARYSQHDESEADSAAVSITVRSGIDPEGLPAFLDRAMAQRTEEPTRIEAFFASHPTDEARISALRLQIARLQPLPAHLLRDTPEFHIVQARLRALPPPPESAQEGAQDDTP